MPKRLSALIVSCMLVLVLGGCWNYRSLDQLSIVVGIAVDFDYEKDLFDISYEIADLSIANKDSGVVGKIVNSQGKTMFDTARNAKRREADRLFFGSPHVLVINQRVAHEIGIAGIIGWFLRDGECRETMCVAISQEETATAMLEGPEDMSGIMSETLHNIIAEDKDVTGTSMQVQLYQVYNYINSARNSVALPVLRKVPGDGEKIPEVNGLAIIKGEHLAGFLSPEQSRYVLFVENSLKGGILTLSMANLKTDDISLEIFSHSASKSFDEEDGKITVKIKTETHVALAENAANLDVMDTAVIKEIEEAASQMIETNIRGLINTLQHEFTTDILGFGEMIYKQDLKLWKQLAPLWDEIYPTVEVEVIPKVKIINAAFNK